MKVESKDTFGQILKIGDSVVVGTYKLEAIITYSGEFYECEIENIDPIPNGPYGDLLYLKKNKYGRNLKKEVTQNRLGKYRDRDLEIVETETEDIQIWSWGVIKINKDQKC
jgi:hypothetical protein